LKEALENVPGLQLREIHGKSGFELSLQGLSSDQVLVLVDGMPLAASTGSTVDLNQYALGEVERIEVVKGAASAQYGSAAMGGVINVITRRSAPGFKGKLSGDVGSYGSQNADGERSSLGAKHMQLGVEGGSDQFRFQFSADQRDDQGFALNPSAWTKQGDDVKRDQYGARLAWLQKNGGEIWLEGSHYNEVGGQRLAAEFFPPSIVYPIKTEEVVRDRYVLGTTQTVAGDYKFQLKGLSESYESHSWKNNNISAANYDRRLADQATQHLSTQLDLPAWGVQQWQIGADWHHERLVQLLNGVSEFTGSDGVTRESSELFAQNDIFLASQWELLIGLRYQNDSDFGDHFAPKASLRWTFMDNAEWNGALRLSAGQGYRVPNLKERYYLFDHSSIGYKVQGNPNLRPESSNSYQLGATLRLHKTLTLDANIFYNDVTDLIQTDMNNFTVINGVAIYTYENIAHARTSGLESAVNWQATPALNISSAYTWTQTKDVNTGTQLTRRPEHIARFGVDWLMHKTRFTLRERYQSDELAITGSNARSPAWAVTDISVTQEINGGVSAFLGVNNVFGQQRDFSQPADFGPIAGRYIYLGATWSWDSQNSTEK
jgi:outer membrane receptor for ferrienterochelin and colicins